MRHLLPALASVLVSGSALAQTPVLVITGRVMADGAALVGADVTAGDVQSIPSIFAKTDANGAFRLVFPRGAVTIGVSARAGGYVSQTKRVTATVADALLRVPEFQLARTVQTLEAMRAVARRSAPSRSFNRPGDTRTDAELGSYMIGDLNGDLSGDLTLALGTIPGMNLTPDGVGGMNLSLAGLNAEQNRITINGSDVAGTPPRDGGIMRVAMSSYDVAEAAGGALLDWIPLSGSGIPQRLLHTTFESPVLQGTVPTGRHFGQRSAAPIVSGRVAGWPGLKPVDRQNPGDSAALRRFYSAVKLASLSFQASRQSADMTTLSSADAVALDALRLNADSVSRLLSSLGSLGILDGGAGSSTRRTATSAKAFTRLDFTTANMDILVRDGTGRSPLSRGSNYEGHTFYVTANGSFDETAGGSLRPSALSLSNNDSRQMTAGMQAVNTSIVHDFIANETRTSVSLSHSAFSPGVALPGASVVMSSALPNGELSLSSVQAAGVGSGKSERNNWVWQTTNVTSWGSVDKRHEWKVALETTLDHLDASSDPGLGAFGFNSLSDFIGGRPASFSRNTSAASASIQGLHAAVGIGDMISTRNFGVQYGVRAEGHQFSSSTLANPAIGSLFAARTGGLPTVYALSPMVGFTWRYGSKNPNGYSTNYLRRLSGGIRDYRGMPRIGSMEPFARETGSLGGVQQLLCVGDAAPAPSWTTYLTSPSTIPTRCADGSAGSAFAQSAPPVAVFAKDYTAMHSIRGELAWNLPLRPGTTFMLRGMSAFNTNQEESFDLNFNGVRRFSLATEGGRPVFVSPNAISPGVGIASATESRVSQAFSQVNERRSDGRSMSNSMTAILDNNPTFWNYMSGIRIPLTLAYTITDVRRRANGFSGTTDGDPRAMTSSPDAVSRHALQVSTMVRNPDWGNLSIGLTVRSGVAYTPRVSGDINGDGFWNDRAFVFDPRGAADAATSGAMSRLLASAPTSAVACLNAQIGTIASQNSCTGPWSATTNVSLSLNTARFRLQNRGVLRIAFLNALSGLDQLLHGSATSHGWGQAAFVDPTLLTVRGFDPSRQQFTYAVNPQFGTTSASRAVFFSPFKIAIDLSIELGPNQEQSNLRSQFRWASRNGTIALDSARIAQMFLGTNRPFFADLVENRDVVHLTAQVADSLVRMQERYATLRESVFGGLAGYIAARNGQHDEDDVHARWRVAYELLSREQFRMSLAKRAMTQEVVVPDTPFRASSPYVRFEKVDEREFERRLRTWMFGFNP